VRQAALVTGAARRIGRTIAARLAAAGYDLAIHAHHSQAEALVLADEIRRGGRRVAVVSADLDDVAQLDPLITEARREIGPLTLLVNNASLYEDDALESLTAANWDRHFAVNLRAPVFLAQAFATQAPQGQNCSIVNITDQRVLKPTPLHPD
jgi:NAD(P)-dependent dehydrogenase (short-subunit alcohol dehydrogenase family)